jgi:hypothetical protein
MLPTSASTGPLTNRRWTARTLIMPPYIRRTGACLIHIKDDEKRKVASDASVSWIGSRHSVSWHNAGKAARIRDHRPPDEIRCSTACVVVHVPAPRRQQIVILSHHHSSSALIPELVERSTPSWWKRSMSVGADLGRSPWPAEIPMHNTGVRP